MLGSLRRAKAATAPLLWRSASAAATTTTTAAAAAAAAPPAPKVKTAIAMLNMGGPATAPDVAPFLSNLFSDRMLIGLGRFQWLGKHIGERRAPKIVPQYEAIGGSPLRAWTEKQGALLAQQLDVISPATAPHKAYPMFRYAAPLTEDALAAIKADGATRAVAFSQYPQFSCTTSGSSLVKLWETEMGGPAAAPAPLEKPAAGQAFAGGASAAALATRTVAGTPRAVTAAGTQLTWSVVDRWNTHPAYIEALAQRIEEGLASFPSDVPRESVVLLFSAHSLPVKTVARGDSYATEIAATAQAAADKVNARAKGGQNAWVLAWQSKVGYLPWLTPSTNDMIKTLAEQGVKAVLAVPVAFTSDHVETLYEVDVEYAHAATEAGIPHFKRAPSLNDSPLLIKAQAEIVAAHLARGEDYATAQYTLKCAGCVEPLCRAVVNPPSLAKQQS